VSARREHGPERLRAFAAILKQNERSFECEVRGRSMGETLKDGARIRVESGESRSYVPGQVVAFLCGDAVIAHRIVHMGRRGRARGHLLTRGDACFLPDPPMPVEAVLGPVMTLDGGDAGSPPPPAPSRAGLRALSREMVTRAISTLMIVHPALAQRAVKGFIAAGRIFGPERS